jgi:hypothetical protein
VNRTSNPELQGPNVLVFTWCLIVWCSEQLNPPQRADDAAVQRCGCERFEAFHIDETICISLPKSKARSFILVGHDLPCSLSVRKLEFDLKAITAILKYLNTKERHIELLNLRKGGGARLREMIRNT